MHKAYTRYTKVGIHYTRFQTTGLIEKIKKNILTNVR